MTSEIATTDTKPTGAGLLIVTVYDLDAGGDPIVVSRGGGAPVRTVIETVYQELNTEPAPGDRLLCQASGESVGAYSNMHLGEYAEAHCPGLVWTFSRDTGGA